MKKSFSLIELIFVISLLILLGTLFNIKIEDNNLQMASNKLILYLKQTRYQALLDAKENDIEELWYKKRWTLKFFRCRKDVGGIYYVIYSDKNMRGHPNFDESLSDPLTNKKIYSSNRCETTSTTSKYVLLTKEYGISNVSISCNNTSSLGQISFGNNGQVYSKLSSYENDEDRYKVEDKCEIRLEGRKKGSFIIEIEGKTGVIKEKE